ncbi:MliC family protein [Halopseudomonas sabulinigri]|uniref:MliC family protein n=1 Tax=Halopseudomonas sabulinigri TaxID=472181 RepID=A0ABP9ZJY7_9GAMM
MNKAPVCIAIATLLGLAATQPLHAAEGPSFDCSKAQAGSIEQLICDDSSLAALDRQLAEVYSAAQKKAANEQPPMLKAEQRGWLSGRNECWKEDDKNACVREAYSMRIAELQARYRLAEMTSVITYACDNNRANELVVSHFSTSPATLIADYGDSTSLMYQQTSTEGSQYRGRNESIAFNDDEAVVVWGYEATPMHCKSVN